MSYSDSASTTDASSLMGPSARGEMRSAYLSVAPIENLLDTINFKQAAIDGTRFKQQSLGRFLQAEVEGFEQDSSDSESDYDSEDFEQSDVSSVSDSESESDISSVSSESESESESGSDSSESESEYSSSDSEADYRFEQQRARGPRYRQTYLLE